MSYIRKETGDTLSDWFSGMADFTNISRNLIAASTKDEFEVWFEQLEQINKRSLFFFLRQNQKRIPREYLESVQWRFTRPLVTGG